MAGMSIPAALLRARALPDGVKVGIVVGACVLVALFWFAAGPQFQPPQFHDFADKARRLGIPNFWNVVSNLAYLGAAVYGFAAIARARRASVLADGLAAWPYVVFFLGVGAITLGSGYYHWVIDPNYTAADPAMVRAHNAALVWDRLAMTLAFMSVPAAFVGDRIDRRFATRILLPLLLLLGAASMAVWHGTGDLRLYRIVQTGPMIAVPLICLLFAGRVTRFRYALLSIAWFGAATVLELYDAAVYEALARTISGHTIKHVVAAGATVMIARMLRDAMARRQE